MKDYGFGNTSQTVNTLGNGVQDLRDIGGLNSNLRSWYEGIGYISTKNIFEHGDLSPDNLRNAAKGLVSASVSASYSQSSYESNTSGTSSVAGNINVGKNFILQSDGDVTLVNQKINVGENFIVDAKNFEVRAGENTYKNDTKSSSAGGSVGYDIVNSHVIGGLNVSGGNSNTSSKYYDNSVINAGGTFQLTTKEDALFVGVNVTADKINFDIGKNLSIISLQDEYKSDGKNYGFGVNVSGKLEGTDFQTETARPSIGGNYGENHQDSKWVNNQTTILAENGGNIKVGETLTNIGAVIGSLNSDEKLSIEANKIVVENLKDHNEGSNYGIGLSGISLNDPKTIVPQTSLQYGSHDKQQDSNATFVNTEITEAGKKLNLEELGINTDINRAQVVTKDEVVEQIDTVLHTDLLNETTRNQVIKDLNGLVQLPADIVRAIQATTENEGSNFLDNLVGTLRNTDADMHNMFTMDKKYKELNKKEGLTSEERAYNSLILANESAEGLRDIYGIEKDVPITVLFADETKGQEAGAFYKEDGSLLIFLDPSVIDMSDSRQVFNGLMYEMNHYNPSNPYVYDKSEKDIEKGYKLEEDFTGIGRKPIIDSENRFYYEILKGSDVLGLGNLIYSEIDDKDLDNHMRDSDDSKFTRSYVNQYQRCYQGGSGASCYNRVDKNAKIAEKRVPKPSPQSCNKACQEKADLKRQQEFTNLMNKDVVLPKSTPELYDIVSSLAAENGQVFGYSTGMIKELGTPKTQYDIQNAVKAGILTTDEANTLGFFTGIAQTGSTLRDELQIPALVIYYSNFQYQQNIKGYEPGYVELDNGAKHYFDSEYYNKYVYEKSNTSFENSLIESSKINNLNNVGDTNVIKFPSKSEEFLNKALKQQELTSIPNGLKQKWVEDGFKYEIRIHDGNTVHTDAKSIYRVARQKIAQPGSQGSGWEYMDSNGNWYQESVLRQYYRDGSLNPRYNEEAARNTHIPVPSK